MIVTMNVVRRKKDAICAAVGSIKINFDYPQ